MKRKTGLAALALLALLGGLAWRTGWRDSARSDEPPTALATDSDASSPQEALLDRGATEDSPAKRVSLPVPARRISLVLRRFPDDELLRAVQLQVDPSETQDSWLTTDERGRIDFGASNSTTKVRINAVGFQPLEIELDLDSKVLERALTPAWGLFGRVLGPDGKPASEIEVTADSRMRTASSLQYVTRTTPEVQVFEASSRVAAARTNPRGFYYLGCETRFQGSPLRVVARSREGGSASLDVPVPRPPELLPELALVSAKPLVVRVVDEAGTPLEGATVFNGDWSLMIPTALDGTCSIVCPLLPASFAARLAGWKQKELRLNGVAVALLSPVESTDTAVEISMAREQGWAIHVIDAATKLAITTHVRGSAEFMLGDKRIGSSSFEFDAEGRSWIPLAIDYRHKDIHEPPGSMKLSISATGYRDHAEDIAIAPAETRPPLEVALEPDPASGLFRGRVVRAGDPVPGLQLGLKVKRRGQPMGWDYIRGYSASDGRFALRWKLHPDDVVVVYPHWKRWDEFGFIGPLSADEATSGEHVLELRASVPVPALLRNVVHSDRYRYYVELVDGELAFSTTINGAPIVIDSDGDARTTLMLPSDRKARITIGYSSEGFHQPDVSNPVDYDPANRTQPLVFELPSLFASVSGHVAGLSDDELSRASVGLTQPGEHEARIVRVGSSGAFEFPNVLIGGAKLNLFLENEDRRTILLSILPVHVEGNVEGLLLSKDPNSLPVTEARGY